MIMIAVSWDNLRNNFMILIIVGFIFNFFEKKTQLGTCTKYIIEFWFGLNIEKRNIVTSGIPQAW